MSIQVKTILIAIFTLFLAVPVVENTAAAAQGNLTGGIASEHPDWFKESFLDIAEDVEEAGESGRHVLLFMYFNGCRLAADGHSRVSSTKPRRVALSSGWSSWKRR